MRGSVKKHIRGEKEEYSSIREKLKITPQSLEDISKIVPAKQEMYNLLTSYYKKKGLQ